ncbi:hypothetical protein AGMMS49975_18820 [Clostridia bacterium]|nr:hypothetical protein AGMMS49975_18820 [Clostridia bacterium]
MKHKWYHSLRFKLFFSFIAVSFIPLIFFSVATTKSMTDAFVQNSAKDLSRSAIAISDQVNAARYMQNSESRGAVNVDFDERSREGMYRILIFDTMSYCISDTNRTDTGKVMLIPEVYAALSGDDSANYKPDGNILYAATAISDENYGIIGAVLLVSSIEELFLPIHAVEKRLFFFLCITLAFIAWLIVLLSKLLIEPLKNVVTSVQKMSDGHLSARTPTKGFDEFADMGRAFNVMAEKLEFVEKTREEFVSNVSHELKTPLSSIKVLTESILLEKNVPRDMYTEFLQDINSEIDRMTFIVNDLLTLVKLDQRDLPFNFVPVDINKMAMDILKRLLPLANKKDVKLFYEEIKIVAADADEMKLTLAISNLVENAIKYTQSGGEVRVIIDADHQNAFITVVDSGIGISEEEQPKIFTRFYRVDKTRDRETGGTGLGLSITHSTVLLHNGSIRVSSSPGEGTVFVVRIPLRAAKEG